MKMLQLALWAFGAIVLVVAEGDESGDCVTACAGLSYNDGCSVDVTCYAGGAEEIEVTQTDTCLAGCLDMESVTACNIDIDCPKMCAEGFRYVEETGECKWSLALAEGDPMTVTCDEQTNEVYADGVSISTSEFSPYYTSPDEVIIPRGSDVIAIKCSKRRGRGGGGAMIAATEKGTLTGVEWKCSSRYTEGWTAKDFDDSSWSAAKDLGEHNVDNPKYGRSEIAGIQNTGAHWIWYDGYSSSAYCRFRLP